jgi:dinuclear metal center YbgI/SA1388 family protein
MKTGDIYEYLDKLSAFELQEKWDNSGLLIGDFEQDITTVVLSIDIDEALIESVEENSLIITHHPIIFGGLKQLRFNEYPSKLLKLMIQKNISNIAMHTNFDQTHLNSYVAETVLGYSISRRDGFVAYFDVNEPFEQFALKIRNMLHLPHLKIVHSHDYVKTAALTTGSGASLIKEVQADCFLTGDIKYHDAMEAKTIGMSMIDIGHYESEWYFGEILEKYLINLGLSVIISPSKNPFTYM